MNGEDSKTIGANRQPNGKFGPGNIANPNGRPVGTLSLVNLIKKKLEDVEPESKRQYAELIVDRAIKESLYGEEVTMLRDLINRIDGMPAQAVKLEGTLEQSHIIELDEQTKKMVEEFVEWRKKNNK